MSRPVVARKMKRTSLPTPHAPAGCGATTRAEALALSLGMTLADIARKRPACKPTRKNCDSDAEFYAVTQHYQADGILSIAGALRERSVCLECAISAVCASVTSFPWPSVVVQACVFPLRVSLAALLIR
jgi:hypothetical protein